jgi:hypothetical protein
MMKASHIPFCTEDKIPDLQKVHILSLVVNISVAGEKKNKEDLQPEDFVAIEGGIFTQEKPHGTHFPVQRPLNKGDKWEQLAEQRAKDANKLVKGSVEIVGRKIQKNVDKYDVDAGMITQLTIEIIKEADYPL